MIETILPAEVACAEAFTDPPEGLLFPAEAATVAEAVEKRRREFTTGRMCARAALGNLGVPPAPIPRGEGGAPRWPSGIVGSITHCVGYRGAAVARAHDILAIGIDAEPDAALPDGVLDGVSLTGERARLRDLAARIPGTSWDRLLFSAKESVYKAWFPLARRWLDFADVDITIDPANGTFAARLLIPLQHADGFPMAGFPMAGFPMAGFPVTGFTGAWLARDGLIVTAIAVPVPSSP